jgi:hypothetical protein
MHNPLPLRRIDDDEEEDEEEADDDGDEDDGRALPRTPGMKLSGMTSPPPTAFPLLQQLLLLLLLLLRGWPSPNCLSSIGEAMRSPFNAPETRPPPTLP